MDYILGKYCKNCKHFNHIINDHQQLRKDSEISKNIDQILKSKVNIKRTIMHNIQM